MNNNFELVLLKKPVYGCKSCSIGIFDNKSDASECCGIGWTYKDVFVKFDDLNSRSLKYHSLDDAFKALKNECRNIRVINREFRINENTKFNFLDAIKVPYSNNQYLVVKSQNNGILECELVECYKDSFSCIISI